MDNDAEPVDQQPNNAPSSEMVGDDMLMKLSVALKDRAQPGFLAGAGRGPSSKRDWSSALDLVNETFEAIRIADERALAAEDYREQLEQHHKEQLRAMESRLAAADKRAEAAEARTKDAESWLARFHDTILENFQKTFVTK